MNKTIIIKELGIEVETELHTEMHRFSLIKIPKGWRLLTISEFFELYNNHFDEFDFENLDEVIENPSIKARIKYTYWNMWLSRLGSYSYVDGYSGDLDCDCTVRGVRFCRKKVNIKRSKVKQ